MTSIVVLVNGASASGKSRLLAGVQRIALDSAVLRDVRIAQRTTTRTAREAESLPTENHYVSESAFEDAVQAGIIDVHWRRTITAARQNRYGFSLASELAHDGVVLVSANDYLDWTAQTLLSELRRQRRLMVVRILASDETRLARLLARRPPLSSDEMESRMAGVPAELLPLADHVVPNNPEFQSFAEWELMRLIAAFRFASGPWSDDLLSHHAATIGTA